MDNGGVCGTLLTDHFTSWNINGEAWYQWFWFNNTFQISVGDAYSSLKKTFLKYSSEVNPWPISFQHIFVWLILFFG